VTDANVEARACRTRDGLTLEAQYAPATTPHPRVGAVLCHPHPQYGGTMRSIVIGALFEALPGHGVACLRFNFRGVEGSEGTHGEGVDEPLDVIGALDVLAGELHPSVPIVLVGWSFGGDMALSVTDERVAAWVGIAPPLRFSAAAHAAGDDARPKLLVLAQHDEFRAPEEIEAATASWVNTRRVVVAGASHFFVGRTERVVDATVGFLDELHPH
jgi:alpha/beta superfamily hydrolase